MTKNKIQKDMAARLEEDCCGMLASINALAQSLGYDRKYVAQKLKAAGCTTFGEGKQKRYFVGEVAEVFCKSAV